jgi:hypothetical protein
MTMPQDHTMFSILQKADAKIWLEKAEYLRQRQGMVLVLTHPDYARDQRVTDGYEALLDTFQDDDTVWRALPREVAAWWRDRAASTIGPDGDGWRIDGPASGNGRVRLAHPGSGNTM